MSGDEPSTWEKMKMNALELIFSDKETQFDEAVRKPAQEKGTTENYKLGLVVNLAQIAVGVGLYLVYSGILAWVGIALAVLSIIAILRWVFGL